MDDGHFMSRKVEINVWRENFIFPATFRLRSAPIFSQNYYNIYKSPTLFYAQLRSSSICTRIRVQETLLLLVLSLLSLLLLCGTFKHLAASQYVYITREYYWHYMCAVTCDH